MSEIKYLPLSFLNQNSFQPLMQEEEAAWLADLGWDYAPIQQILASFIRQKLLPGYGAISENRLLGYTYFLVNQAKGIIGAIYASKSGPGQHIDEKLLSLTIEALHENPQIKRIEAQIMPFHGAQLTPTFARNGFNCHPRYYLSLKLNDFRSLKSNSEDKIVAWDSHRLRQAAEMTAASYYNQLDAVLCEDYRTIAGCESYLRSLIENPGCGIFMPEASFMCMDDLNAPCGFVMTCRISDRVGMIPQIAVHPSLQAKGLGNALIQQSFEKLKAMGFHSVTLTVSKDNARAFDWYQRVGFKIQKEFGAYIWERNY
jgi:ribosomal protein S18 acetylase RimI-like enzyme